MNNHFEFVEYIKKASSYFRDLSKPSVVPIISHLDADGISACAILNRAFMREGIPFQNTILPQLTENDIIALKDHEEPLLCFTDFGSGQVELIRKHLPDKKILILDHHELPTSETQKFTQGTLPSFETDHITHVNPHFFDIDGGSEISGSGVVYLFAKALDKENQDMAHIAVVGALGDVQEKDGALISMNKLILDDALESGRMEVKHDLKFYGVQSRTLPKILSSTTDPYFPMVSNNEPRAIQFLHEIGIDPIKDNEWKYLRDLNDAEKEKLIVELIKIRSALEDPEDIFGNYYLLTEENEGTPFRDGKEFATLLNSCGRIDKADDGIGACLNIPDYKEQALANSKEYKGYITKALRWFSSNKNNQETIHEADTYMIINAGNEILNTIIGTMISILTKSGRYPPGYIMLSMARAPNNVTKVSIRRVEKAPDDTEHKEPEKTLKEVIEQICTIAGGEFGGHDNAAGALIDTDTEEPFIKAARDVLDSLE
jgi:RecJ-like exonuclease